jgi:hypothetical protein
MEIDCLGNFHNAPPVVWEIGGYCLDLMIPQGAFLVTGGTNGHQE